MTTEFALEAKCQDGKWLRLSIKPTFEAIREELTFWRETLPSTLLRLVRK